MAAFLALPAGALLMAGCSPALNWREVSPEGAAVRLMFPCKPAHEDRMQQGPEGRRLTVRSFSCKAQGSQFALTWVDLGTTKEVPAALRRLHDQWAQVLEPGASAPLAIAGMTADPAAGQLRWEARNGAPGQAVRQAVFARGPRVYQLLLQGERVDDEAWDVFLGSVVLGSD
ncbi:hypothetical protein SAMN05216359_11779 [Roseateles sp. YR242]|uniref:hypothetical protein n=1 Tax=Roseateles sp. YR242 TaxID=1855305 RepID=UPI0008AEAF31|nr:hypothetical protein [Roseateles sp. YR242]SEL80252.1 hypothetical protein SAMN05216359_11779 [Roseateles sp. YR242]